MAQRLNNLLNAVAESIGSFGALGLSAVGCTAYAGVYLTYERSDLTSLVSVIVLGLTLAALLSIYLNAVSQGSNKPERARSVNQFAPLLTTVFNMGLLLSFVILFSGDDAIAYFSAHPKHLYLTLGVSASLIAIAIVSAFSWVFARMRMMAITQAAGYHTGVSGKVEVTEQRVPTVSLQYSEKDRKRKAAHFAGRIMCFAGSPYLDEDFDFDINEEFAEISYRGDNTFEDEDFLFWMTFQLLCAQQAEAAFAKKTSKISWEHYGDIEHYVAEVLASRPGASRILKDPKTPAEHDWRAKRIRFFVKETIPRVHSFIRENQDQLKQLVSLTMSGALTGSELRSILRTVDTAHLPGHWEENGSSRSHLTLVSSN